MKKNMFLTMVMALMTAVAAFSCGKMDETETVSETEESTVIEETILTEKVIEETIITEAIVFKQIPEVTTVTEITTVEEIPEVTTRITMYGINPEIEAQLAYHQLLAQLEQEKPKTIDDTYEKEKAYNSQVNIYFGRK